MCRAPSRAATAAIQMPKWELLLRALLRLPLRQQAVLTPLSESSTEVQEALAKHMAAVERDKNWDPERVGADPGVRSDGHSSSQVAAVRAVQNSGP